MFNLNTINGSSRAPTPTKISFKSKFKITFGVVPPRWFEYIEFSIHVVRERGFQRGEVVRKLGIKNCFPLQ